MIRIVRQEELKEGRWRNGMGVSWEIAAHRLDAAADFSWRFAKARIDGDVPFSIYPGMDRMFMMLEGGGMDLEFEGGEVLQVRQKFVPHNFSCDVPLNCKLRGGPSMDLNLFWARDKLHANCDVVGIDGEVLLSISEYCTVMYALEGECKIGELQLNLGDGAIVERENFVAMHGKSAQIFIGRLFHRQ
jgi:uncharacterized protein